MSEFTNQLLTATKIANKGDLVFIAKFDDDDPVILASYSGKTKIAIEFGANGGEFEVRDGKGKKVKLYCKII